MNYKYNNICITIDFFEDKYTTVIYPTAISAEELNDLFVDHVYGDGFSLESLIREIDSKIKNHPALKDTSESDKKQKLYAILSWICWGFVAVVVGILVIYVSVTKKTLTLSPLIVFCISAIPFAVGSIFNFKSRH